MSQPPRFTRGPRIAHGLGAALAATLAPRKVAQEAQGAALDIARDTLAMLDRMRVAEAKVAAVQQLITAWRGQCLLQPVDSPLRNIAETLIGGLETVLVQPKQEAANETDAGSNSPG